MCRQWAGAPPRCSSPHPRANLRANAAPRGGLHVCERVRLHFPAGREDRRFHSVRGWSVLHRGPRLDGCRCREDRKPQNGRPRPPAPPRPAGRRPLLLPRLQRQQEVHHGQSQVPQGARVGQGHDPEGRRDDRELRARRHRAAGPVVRRREGPQSGDHLRAGQGLRRGQPVRAEPGLRHDCPGLRRHVQRHRRQERPTDRPASPWEIPGPAC